MGLKNANRSDTQHNRGGVDREKQRTQNGYPHNDGTGNKKDQLLHQSALQDAVSTKDQMADLLTKPLPEDEFTKFKNRIMGKAVNISTYLQGSVRKPEVMRTRARKEREYKNGANIWKASNCTHRAICESGVSQRRR